MRTILSLFVTCVFFLQAGSGFSLEMTVNKIAAVVNGEMLTLHDLRGQTMAELHRRNLSPNDPNAENIMRQVLESRINDILLRQEAERYKITVSDADIDSELNRIAKGNNMTRKQFESQLAKQGTTIETVREQLRNNILRQRIISFMISRKVVVTKEEITDYYNKHKDEFVGGKTVDFSVIVFGKGSKPENIYSQLQSGALGFEEAAAKYSQDATAKRGGHVGQIPWASLPGPFQQLLSSLSPGKLSPLISIEGAPAVIRLNGISDGSAKSLEEAYAQIEQMLKEPRLQERFVEYTQQLRQKAVVDIRL